MVADKVLGVHNAPVALARTTTAIVHLKVSAASPNKDSRLADLITVAGGSLRRAYGGEDVEGGLRTFQHRSLQSSYENVALNLAANT